MKGGKTDLSQRVNVAAQLGQNLFNLLPTQDCVEEWGEWWLLRGHDDADGKWVGTVGIRKVRGRGITLSFSNNLENSKFSACVLYLSVSSGRGRGVGLYRKISPKKYPIFGINSVHFRNNSQKYPYSVWSLK